MNNKAFTLIELLVAVLIIGILAAIAVPKYQMAVDKAKFSALMNITRALADANEGFYLLHNYYSEKYTDLDINIPADSIAGHTAHFDWGYCYLSSDSVLCYDDKINSEFSISYKQAKNYAGYIFCNALTTQENSRSDRLCQHFGKFYRENNCRGGVGCRMYIIRK